MKRRITTLALAVLSTITILATASSAVWAQYTWSWEPNFSSSYTFRWPVCCTSSDGSTKFCHTDYSDAEPPYELITVSVKQSDGTFDEINRYRDYTPDASYTCDNTSSINPALKSSTTSGLTASKFYKSGLIYIYPNNLSSGGMVQVPTPIPAKGY